MEMRPGTSAATVPRGGRRALVLVRVMLALILALVLGGALAGPAAAQTTETSDAEAPVEVEGDGAVAGQAVADEGESIDDAAADDAGVDDEAENEVRLIVGLLIGVSVVAVVLTALFWYHTIPSRRVIAARRRRARAAKTRSARRTSASGPDDLRAS
ncbi:MAG: hypothetical protein MUE34_17690 [Acidimicrobiales bacterium]|jgi:hypothetical protein|nr:hypothetical protein [Acidimicrobiales bacterium]